MLTDMGIDAKNHCVPLTYAIVNVENKDNLSYLFNYFSDIIGDGSVSEYTFIIDGHKVIS